MIYAINYVSVGSEGAGAVYIKARDYNTKTAYERGYVDKVIEWSPEMIQDYVSQHKEIFDISRGAGLWLWKPYVILQTLKQINDGDYVIYADAGSFYIDKVQPLIDVMKRDDVWLMPYEMPLLNRQFCKHESYVLANMPVDDANQICATELIVKKCPEAVKFVEEWLHLCEDIRILSPERFCHDIEEFPDFITHREDQAVYSLMVHKYGLQVYREPTEAGIMPWCYAYSRGKYMKKQYKNSPYGVILLNARQNDPEKYERDFLKGMEHLKHSWISPETKLFVTWKIKHLGKVLLLSLGLKGLYKKLKNQEET